MSSANRSSHSANRRASSRSASWYRNSCTSSVSSARAICDSLATTAIGSPLARGPQLSPARRVHELGPAAEETPRILLAEEAPAIHGARPVVAHEVVAQHVLHLTRGIRVHQVPAPRLGQQGAARLRHQDGPRERAMERHVREDGAAPVGSRLARQAPLALGVDLLVVLADDRVLEHRRVVVAQVRHTVAGPVAERWKRYGAVPAAAATALVLGPPRARLPGATIAEDVHRLHRLMRRGAMVEVADVVLHGELPVAAQPVLLHPDDRLGAALAAVPAVQQGVEPEPHAPQVLEEGRGGGVPRGPDGALVIHLLRDVYEPPRVLVELPVVGILKARYAQQVARHLHYTAVDGVRPAVVRAGERLRVALVVAAHLHAAVPAGIEQDVNPALQVAGKDDGLLAHAGDEVVTRMGDLALVPNEQPGAREDMLLLALVDLLAHEDLTADDAVLQVDQVPHRRIRAGHSVASCSCRCRVDQRATSATDC